MIVNCPGCKADIELPQDFLYHAAFIQRSYLYCEACPSTLRLEAADSTLQSLVGAKHPWTLAYRERRLVESKLKPCACGGRYGFENPPRCPQCRASWATLVPDRLQFYEVGRVLDASRDSVWA